ncbi:MAG: OmpH family outer membrane protein [Bacteroidales bacterium]|nr:OmpH family outer membrane protein [Bacteroidales bacterium]
MRKLIAACILILLFSVVNLSAQTKQKIGHINSEELLQAMPQRDSVKAKIEALAKTLDTQLKAMEAELQTKYTEYMSKEKEYTDLIKQTKQKELSELQTRIQEFQQNAQDELQKKQNEFLSPIIDKAKKAIEDVAKENGYTYIFDSSQSVGSVLYSDKGDDILVLVKKKLGLIK